jgi:hypothetical protein
LRNQAHTGAIQCNFLPKSTSSKILACLTFC